MNFRRCCLLLGGLLLAPIPVRAQGATELQAHALVNVGGDRFLGGGVGVALRTNGRMRVGVVLNVGDLERNAAVRPELIGSFHLNPFKRQGLSPYAGGGVAVILANGTTREYIVALLGLESRPGRSAGWFAEVGLGGGVRVLTGVQFRKRHRRAR